MKHILVIGGTADSSEFIRKAPKDYALFVTTFSELGAKVTPEGPNIKTIYGALNDNDFENLMRQEQITHAADLSHPFATEVSKNAKAAASRYGIPYYRFERSSFTATKNIVSFPDFDTAAEALKKTEGNLFLTIGSRNLRPFISDPKLKERCYMRVLADSRILKELEDENIDSGRIFAMKGVASKELNIALAKAINAKAIVTKDSGKTGGLTEKYEAAAALNIPLVVIKRPENNDMVFRTVEELLERIRRD